MGTGSKLFAALKGAVDGGLSIPPSRFVGFSKEDKKLDVGLLRSHIFGGHVAEYMRQFGAYIKAGVKADDLEALYAKLHANIRKNPEFQSNRKYVKPAVKKFSKRSPMSYSQRRDRVRQKIVSHKKRQSE